MNVPTMAEMLSQGKIPEVLFWVGAAGSYDDRAKKITRAFVKLLHKANVDFARNAYSLVPSKFLNPKTLNQ